MVGVSAVHMHPHNPCISNEFLNHYTYTTCSALWFQPKQVGQPNIIRDHGCTHGKKMTRKTHNTTREGGRDEGM